MTLHEQVIETKAIVKKTVKTHTCDICGDRDMSQDKAWNIGAKLEYWDYGGLLKDNETYVIDVCAHCMEKEVMPLVCKEYNIEPRSEVR